MCDFNMKPYLPHQVNTQYLLSAFKQTSFFYLGKFLKKSSDDQCSSIKAVSASFLCIYNLLVNYVNILSDPTIGSSVHIYKQVLQLSFRISCYFIISLAKSTQNGQNLKFSADPPHKIWE